MDEGGSSRRDPPAGLGPELDRDGVQGGAGFPAASRSSAPCRSTGRTSARSSIRGAPAGHARPALWVPAGADAGLAGGRDARLAVGRGRARRRADRHAGNGLASAHRPDRRASSGPAADHRPPGRPRRHHHPEGRRRDGAHAGAHQAGPASQRGVKATGAPGYCSGPYPFRSMHPYLRQIYDAFGPERMFWGTDITKMPCSWRQCVTMFTEELPWLPERDKELVMGEAVCAWWGWNHTG